MSVMLSAASCLDWAARIMGIQTVPKLLEMAGQASSIPSSVIFLPYLSGERTPHNNPRANGMLFGLTHQHDRKDIAKAVIEG